MTLADSARHQSLASADGYWAEGHWTGERPAWRWAFCLGAVLAVHGIAYLVATRVPPVLPVTPPPAMVVDLAIPAPPPPIPVPPQPVTPPPPPPPPPPPKVIDIPPPPPPKVLAPDPIPLPPKPPKPPKHKPPPRKPPPPKPVVVQPQVEAPPPVQAPPPKPAAPAAPSPQVTASYTSKLLGQLERYKEYPEDARRKGIEGQPQIRIVIDRQGKLLSAVLVHGSGHESLDDEAVALAERAAPFPPLPDDMPGAEQSFTIPIDFNLH